MAGRSISAKMNDCSSVVYNIIMALQLEYPVKSTDMTASSAYVKIIQSNINFGDETT